MTPAELQQLLITHAPGASPPAVRYGATITCRDGWKLFLSCYGTTRPGQPRPDQPYHPAAHI
jgi:hypothetical protein